MPTKVEGKDKGGLRLLALSTCVWCKKMKNLLNKLGVSYEYEDIDLLEGRDRERAMEEFEKWNPGGGFPLLIIDDKKCIKGFNEEEIREALK